MGCVNVMAIERVGIGETWTPLHSLMIFSVLYIPNMYNYNLG
jgi:hypothetical protein